MTRNQSKRRMKGSFENKGGVLVPKSSPSQGQRIVEYKQTVPVSSGDGRDALEQLVEVLEDKIPKQVLRANYDGRVSHSIKSNISSLS